MGFKKYKLIDDVLQAFDLNYAKADFLLNVPKIEVPALLSTELTYTLNNIPYKVSEAAIRENVIYPILKEVFKRYDDVLMLWANKSITFDKDLGGIPDYLVAKQSERGKIIFGKPLLAVVEAKKDDFEGGWAQCLLEMVAIQKINQKPDLPVYGIVSNGDIWEFGVLNGQDFIAHSSLFTLSQLEALYASLCYLFVQCKENALAL